MNMNYEKLLAKYIDIVGEDHRKEYSQFFTPKNIAHLMCKWVCKEGISDILDPALGLGIFAEEALKINKNINFYSYEKDDVIFDYAKNISNKIIRKGKDYLLNDWNYKYNGILCNPPYFKFHNYDNKGYINEISDKLGIKLSGYSNLYVLFLIKSLFQLEKKGRMAYIIPSEFMNTNYGKLIKKYIIDSKMLKHVFVFDSKFSVFNNAITTTSILFFSNENNEEIGFSNIVDKSDLRKINDFVESEGIYKGDFNYSISDINPNEKWEILYSKKNKEYINLVPFSKFAKVKRGIATGANDFFVFNKEKIEKERIPKEHFEICICKSNYINTSFLDNNAIYKLESTNSDVYLLNIYEDSNPELRKYIKLGEKKGYNLRYLTKNRTPWYSMESKEKSPILVSVFNRGKVKFIRNDANVSNLTTFHNLYTKRNNKEEIDLLFAYLLTDTARDLLQFHQRTYGNGLKKLEPNDINNSQIVDLDLIPKADKENILYLLEQYRISKENNIYLDKIDQIFKTKFYKVK